MKEWAWKSGDGEVSATGRLYDVLISPDGDTGIYWQLYAERGLLPILAKIDGLLWITPGSGGSYSYRVDPRYDPEIVNSHIMAAVINVFLSGVSSSEEKETVTYDDLEEW